MEIKQPLEAGLIMNILTEAIKREEESYEYYYNASRKATKPATKKLLLELAEWEKSHIEELQHHVAELKAQKEIDRAMTGGI